MKQRESCKKRASLAAAATTARRGDERKTLARALGVGETKHDSWTNNLHKITVQILLSADNYMKVNPP